VIATALETCRPRDIFNAAGDGPLAIGGETADACKRANRGARQNFTGGDEGVLTVQAGIAEIAHRRRRGMVEAAPPQAAVQSSSKDQPRQDAFHRTLAGRPSVIGQCR